jgi:cellulose biosynthesis protein BcsQ
MALNEKRTLLIDLDPQANASSGMGIRLAQGEPSVYQFLLMGERHERIIKSTMQEQFLGQIIGIRGRGGGGRVGGGGGGARGGAG